jgi:hypothetical protein
VSPPSFLSTLFVPDAPAFLARLWDRPDDSRLVAPLKSSPGGRTDSAVCYF